MAHDLSGFRCRQGELKTSQTPSGAGLVVMRSPIPCSSWNRWISDFRVGRQASSYQTSKTSQHFPHPLQSSDVMRFDRFVFTSSPQSHAADSSRTSGSGNGGRCRRSSMLLMARGYIPARRYGRCGRSFNDHRLHSYSMTGRANLAGNPCSISFAGCFRHTGLERGFNRTGAITDRAPDLHIIRTHLHLTFSAAAIAASSRTSLSS
jgi:hypothetical protein